MIPVLSRYERLETVWATAEALCSPRSSNSRSRAWFRTPDWFLSTEPAADEAGGLGLRQVLLSQVGRIGKTTVNGGDFQHFAPALQIANCLCELAGFRRACMPIW